MRTKINFFHVWKQIEFGEKEARSRNVSAPLEQRMEVGEFTELLRKVNLKTLMRQAGVEKVKIRDLRQFIFG